MKRLILSILSLLLIAGCTQTETVDTEAAKQGMIDADEAFSVMSVENGMRPAFDFYMADSATMYRNGMDPITGRETILSLYPSPGEQAGILSWEPFQAEVGGSGDLGYTLGKWTYTVTDTLGEESQAFGYYVTIWKQQPDGSWKYIFDTGISGPQPEEEESEVVPEE